MFQAATPAEKLPYGGVTSCIRRIASSPSSSDAFGRSAANSSPPSRAMMSPSRSAVSMRSSGFADQAIALVVPLVSLTTLSPSRSTVASTTGLPGAGRACELGRGHLLPTASVEHPGELVDDGLPAQPRGQPHGLARDGPQRTGDGGTDDDQQRRVTPIDRIGRRPEDEHRQVGARGQHADGQDHLAVATLDAEPDHRHHHEDRVSRGHAS